MRMHFTLIWLAALALAAPLVADDAITHGPILGRLGAREVGVWARTAAPGEFRVRYGTTPGSLREVSPPVATELGRDNTGWAHIHDLEPNTKYFYAVTTGSDREAPPEHRGSFRTLPSSDQFRHPKHNPKGLFNFSFEYGCGNHQASDPTTPAFKTMLERLDDKIHFAILDGDWLYEEKREFTVPEWLQQVKKSTTETPRVVELAPTIVGVWENYKLYLSRGKNLAAWHREMPSFFVFDDHEILNDVNGAGEIGLRSRRAVFRDIGVQAWYDYLGWSNPVSYQQKIHFGRTTLAANSDVLVDARADFRELDLDQAATLLVHWGGPTAGVNNTKLDQIGGDPNAGVYAVLEVIDQNRLRISPAPKESGEASYSIGRLSYFRKRISNADFFVVDTRSHRQIHDRRNPFKKGVSILGERQKRWLKQGMSSSDADFLFVVSSVNLMVPHVLPNNLTANKDEAWTAVAIEREELINFWDSLGKPVFVLTGDLHNSFAIKITDRVWEFASGPHNSGNHTLAAEANRPPNGKFSSRGRECEIRWSTFFVDDLAGGGGRRPVYCVVKINNVFNNRTRSGEDHWVSYTQPQVVFQYYDGLNGDLLYAESILAER